MKIVFSLLKIIGFNTLNFFILILILELIFGSWLQFLIKKKSNIPIPALIIDATLYFNPEKINKDKNMKIIQYKRNKYGYRSYDINTKKPLFLSIGGSTTDQKFITEGDTWQDILDEKFPEYEFVNAGVGGHSSYGHYISLENWHSKNLDPDKVKYFLYYIGINDVTLLKNEIFETKKIYTNEKSKFTIFRNFLKENSFFVKRIYILKNKLGLIDLNANRFNSHFMRKEDFLKKGKIFKIENDNYLDNFPKYKNIFINLVKDNFKFFPHSTVFIVQQQIPGCKYISTMEIEDRHPNNNKYCLNLLKVYNLQKYYLKEYLSEYNIKLIEMYKENILDDNHVYDYIHNNKLGSRRIADYIEYNIQEELNR